MEVAVRVLLLVLCFSHGSITVTRDVGANPEVQNVVDLTKQLFFSSSPNLKPPLRNEHACRPVVHVVVPVPPSSVA
jgi:hypothetical protein